jgi:hypothetical protein
MGRSIHLEHQHNGTLLHVDPDGTDPEQDDGPGSSIRERFASLILFSAEDTNHVVGKFTGRESTYSGGAALWKTLRIDPCWMEAMRRRTRKKARAAYEMARQRLTKELNADGNPMEWWAYRSRHMSWRYRDIFLTLKMPPVEVPCSSGSVPVSFQTLPTTSLLEVRRFNLAFRLLAKTPFWRKHVFAGIKAVEDKLTGTGPYVHGHFLLISRKMDQDVLRSLWRQALSKATKKIYGPLARLANDADLPHLMTVKAKVRNENEISTNDALDEVCKYMTKAEDLLLPEKCGGVSGDVLLELCLVPRWPRMAEVLGKAIAEAKPGAARPSLDTSCISVHPEQLPLPPYWEEGGIEPEERLQYSLQLRETFALSVPKKPPRPPTWRQLMASTTLHEWLQIIAARVASARAYRLKWLRTYNPDLDVVDMAGNRYVADEWPEGLDVECG